MVTISEEEENYARMSLLLYGIAPRAARAFFDTQFHPEYLYKSIKKEFVNLKNLQKDRKINHSQWQLLFPRKGVPDSKTFDVTLIILLLRNLIHMDPPVNGFDILPSVTNSTPSAALATIKCYRNHIAHIHDAQIESVYFNKAWEDISAAVEKLGGKIMLDECEVLRTKILEHSTVPWNIRVQIDQILEEWKTNNLTFVETRAAKHVYKCIQENSCVTITASSGVGKTATLQHVVLKMVAEGYNVLLVTNASEIVKFYNPYQKTLYVMDDFCGMYSFNQLEFPSLEKVKERLKVLMKNKLIKIIVACRLQVYLDEKFTSLSIFRTCVCNLLSEDLCLSRAEKQSIAESLLETNSSKIIQYCDLYDCFPLLCKLYYDNPQRNIVDFFKNPFSVYETEMDKLYENRNNGKYCALALCVMFNNKLKEIWLTDEIDKEKRKRIKNTCEACRLDRGTSRLVLLDELKTLEHTFIKKEQGVYKIIHDKLFDFLSYYFGHNIIQCLIRNASSSVIMQRFLLYEGDNVDKFIIVVPSEYHPIYIQRMIDDWSAGKLYNVIFNLNMKIAEFRSRFLDKLQTLSILHQRQLAHTCDGTTKSNVLLYCCYLCDFPMIQWCIQRGVDINQCNDQGISPVLFSVDAGHLASVKLLLHHKADINKCIDKIGTPLVIACEKNYIEIAKLLIDNKADTNLSGANESTPLNVACQLGHLEIVRMLLDNKSDINRCTNNYQASPLYFACQNNRKEIVKILLDNKADINKCTSRGLSSLVVACQENHIEVVKLLLSYNADINNSFYRASPLLSACCYNHIKVVEVLLDNNANINKGDANDRTPLFIACYKNHIEIVKLLLRSMADVNKCTNEFPTNYLLYVLGKEYVNTVRTERCTSFEGIFHPFSESRDDSRFADEGASPLFIACKHDCKEIVQLLLNSKADINKCTYEGESPLFIACKRNHKEIVKILLDKNPDINHCTSYGSSPLFVAFMNNHKDVVQLLLEKGADGNIVISTCRILAWYLNMKK